MIYSIETFEHSLHRSYLLRLLALLLIKFLFITLLILTYEIHLAPDEAQYWAWSQALDWGYYSKPPGIAWQIWATTSLFGSHEWGVRAGALIIGFCLPLALYRLSSCCRLSPRISFWSGVVMALSPGGFFFSCAAATDPGATLFLILAIAEIAHASPHYLKAGLYLALGALFKWTVYALWPLTLVMMCFHKPLRRFSFFGGLLLSLTALLPTLYWNQGHDWATFRHVGTTLAYNLAKPNPWDFLGSQIALISPLFFLLLIASYFYRKPPKLTYLSLFPASLLGLFIYAFFHKVQPNWGDFLYPPATILIAWAGLEKCKRGTTWLILGSTLSVIGILGVLAIPGIQKHALWAHHPIPYKLNPFQQNLGWDHLKEALDSAGYHPEKHFLCADRYQTTSLCKFYISPKTYFFNISKNRKNQFSYQTPMSAQEKGKEGYFVMVTQDPSHKLGWIAPAYTEKLSPYFEKVTFVDTYPLFHVYGQGVKHLVVFYCENYTGLSPVDPALF